MYSYKFKTLTEKIFFSTHQHSAKNGCNDDVFQQKEGKDTPSPKDATNPEKMDCSVCMELERAWNEHLKSHRGKDVPLMKRSVSRPSTQDGGNTPEVQRKKLETASGRNTSKIFEKSITNKHIGLSVPDNSDFNKNTAGGKLQKIILPELQTDKVKIRKPKLKQLTLVTMTRSLKRTNELKNEQSLFEKGDKERATIKSSTSREENTFHSALLEQLKREECDFSPNNQRITRSTLQPSTSQQDATPPAASLEPFKDDKFNFLPVKIEDPQRATKLTVKAGISGDLSTPNPASSVKEEYDFLPTKKRNMQPATVQTTRFREPTHQTALNWEPFKKEKCDFVPVLDTFGRYPCLWCKKTFSTPYNLSRHILKHKENKNKPWFPCAECGKKFDRKDCLKIHLLSHKNDRPHVCGICRRRFKHKCHLDYHLKFNRCFKKDSLAYY